MPTVLNLERAFEDIAPPHFAQSWDNVGLLTGNRSARVRRCLLCIDLSPPVLAEARLLRCQMVVTYHPPLFKPVSSLTSATDRKRGPATMTEVVHDAICAGIAIYSPHTALDAADGGTGDAIAALCGATIEGPLEHAPEGVSALEVKIAVFVPVAAVDTVAAAMFAVGAAGRIGAYEQCSFRIPGTGTFFGTDETNPRVGRRGRLETVEEIRLEMVCHERGLPEVIAAMRAAHPYEEPAFDVYALRPKPSQQGVGRLARFTKPPRLRDLARLLARKTGATAPLLIGDPLRRVKRVAILVGSAGRVYLDYPRSNSAQVLITGEIRHHDALALKMLGWGAIALGHWHSERPVLKPLAAALTKRVSGVEFRISAADADPFTALKR